MFNKQKEHCAVYYNNKIFDISGIISKKDFVILSDTSKNYCMKYYKPIFIKDNKDFDYYKDLFVTEIKLLINNT